MTCSKCDVNERDAKVHTMWSKIANVPFGVRKYDGEPTRMLKGRYSERRVYHSITIGRWGSDRSWSMLPRIAFRALPTGFANTVAVALWAPSDACIGRADKEHGDGAVALLFRAAITIPVPLEARLAFPPIHYGAFSGERR
jgi:hypothetical protein